MEAGTDKVDVEVVTDAQTIADDYIFMAAIRLVGGKSCSDIHQHTLTADIVSHDTFMGREKEYNNLALLPNPVGNVLTLRTDEVVPDDIRVSVFTLSGKKVLVQQGFINGSEIKQDVNGLPKGMYFISTNKFYHKRLVFTKQ